MELDEVEHPGSDRSMEPAWDLLRASGFSVFDRVRLEFEKPHYLAYLFDSADECLNVVRGLHDDSAKIGDILKDAKILHKWSKDCEPLFRVNRRLDHLSCKRYRLQEPLKILASEAYSEILGLDVVLQSRVSKSTHRYLVANPGASKTELETSAREYWLSVLVTFLEESDMPICKIAAGTTDPGAVLRRSFGSRRMKTLRNRARAWKKVRSWMLLMRGRPFPIDISDMLDHILFLVQEEASRSRIIEVSCALSVLEEAGQVASEDKISDSSLWKQAINSRLCEIEQDGCTVSKAPPLSVATLISLELFILDTGNRLYCRAIAWVILLCVWGCMRLSDLEGLDPQRIHLSSRGLRAILVRTKTTGPGKRVKETPIFLARRISFTGVDWLKIGLDIWDSFERKSRDYFVFAADKSLGSPIFKYASVETVAQYVRHVLSLLGVPSKQRTGGWKVKDLSLFEEHGELFWSGHSMRHFLPSVAASVDIGKEQRDYVGRWHVNQHQSADYVHTSRQIVTRVQESVNRCICSGGPGYDESELLTEYKQFLEARGVLEAGRVAGRHHIWRNADDGIGYMLGVKWPTFEVLENPDHVWDTSLVQTGRVEIDHREEISSSPSSRTPPYFVSITRRTGFRRLHKTSGCGVIPERCYKVEWVWEVNEKTADAVCKVCLARCGKSKPDSSSSSSGSSSSTDDADEAEA